ncbi:MAG: hypothetical protein SGI89_06875 [bacterium]|nr:hypothetical protein [bacterium]
MQNTRLIQLLKTLTQTEFREFKDFVSSPFYNKNKNVISLFEYLKKFYPDFNSEKLTDENAFKKLFPSDEYNYFKLKNIISDLLVLGREFLAAVSFQNNINVKDKMLLEQFRDRDLDNMYEQLYRTVKKNTDVIVVKDEAYFLKCLELTYEYKDYISPKEPNSHFNLFQDQLDFFINYSLIKLLRIYNTMLHESKQNNYDFDYKMYDQVFDYLNKNKNESNPTILLYYNIILLEKDKEEKYFYELKNIKEKYYDELNSFDKYMYYLHMAGFCADAFNDQSRTDFMREHFLLSKENFDRGTIELGKILYMDFLNHVKIALRVNEFEWAENYINTFKDKLTEEKDSTLNFCYGVISYKKGDLDTALELFSKANFPNYIIKLQVKILLLQVYFEKGFYDQAESMIDAFRHYLNREKSIKENFKESFYEYLRLTNDLIKIMTNINIQEMDFEVAEIKKEINSMRSNQFGIKLWLQDRIAKTSDVKRKVKKG